MVNNLRIDYITQGPEGSEKPANRLNVNSEDFLWIYVEATLPSGIAPKGEYFKMNKDKPDPATRKVINPPKLVDGHYRFSVIHYLLSQKSKYLFHFADDLATPKYQDQWEIVTQ